MSLFSRTSNAASASVNFANASSETRACCSGVNASYASLPVLIPSLSVKATSSFAGSVANKFETSSATCSFSSITGFSI